MRRAYPIQLDRRFGWIPSSKYNGKRNIFNSRLTVLEDSTRSNGKTGPFSAIKSRERYLYALYFGSFTHMTGVGNKVIADTIAAGLSDRPPVANRR